MLLRRTGSGTTGRVNPLAPSAVLLVGVLLFLTGQRLTGAGVGVGACLATLNLLVLSRRVDVAADLGDVGRALLSMQIGLLLSASVIGAVIVVIIKVSLAMAVAAAVSFAVTQIVTIGSYYLVYDRSANRPEQKAL